MVSSGRCHRSSSTSPASRSLAQQRLPRLLTQSLQPQGARPNAVAHERGDLLQRLRPRRGDDEQRDIHLVLPEELDELDQRRLRPVQVLEDERHRTPAREQLEDAADAPMELRLSDLGRLVRPARRRRHVQEVGHRRRHRPPLLRVLVAQALEQRTQLRADRDVVVALEDAGGILDDLHHRPVRDALPVGQAAAPVRGRPLLPIPGRPVTSARPGRRSTQTFCHTSSNRSSSASRPTR